MTEEANRAPKQGISRRRFLGATLAAAAAPSSIIRAMGGNPAGAAPSSIDDIPVIDTHIHLFDPSRPQGVPWPESSDSVRYKTALPPRYRGIAAPLGIRGAIEVECSPWLEDNQWVLDVAQRDTIIVGTVGDLEPGNPQFPRQLERFHANPLFRGIRYGNLWGRDLGSGLGNPRFVADLKRLSDAGLVLDTANPTPRLLADVVRLTDLVSGLRVVVDHLPSLQRPDEPDSRSLYDSSLAELGGRPQVYAKVSAILRRVGGVVSHDLGSYRETLDRIYGVFGPNRVIYGSDWPNSDPLGSYGEVLGMARAYFETKGRDVAERYFWRNSVAAYRWIRRDAGQMLGT